MVHCYSSTIERASREEKMLLIMGDANLCSKKWNEDNFTHKKMANQLISTLDSCGLQNIPIGPTFIMDHHQTDGTITESWLDHVYHSEQLKPEISTNVKIFGSSDHLTVLTCLKTIVNRKSHKRKIVKRKMKDFNDAVWNEALAKRDWSEINTTNNLNKKVEIFTKLVTDSLDEVAPYVEAPRSRKYS